MLHNVFGTYFFLLVQRIVVYPKYTLRIPCFFFYRHFCNLNLTKTKKCITYLETKSNIRAYCVEKFIIPVFFSYYAPSNVSNSLTVTIKLLRLIMRVGGRVFLLETYLRIPDPSSGIKFNS